VIRAVASLRCADLKQEQAAYCSSVGKVLPQTTSSQFHTNGLSYAGNGGQVGASPRVPEDAIHQYQGAPREETSLTAGRGFVAGREREIIGPNPFRLAFEQAPPPAAKPTPSSFSADPTSKDAVANFLAGLSARSSGQGTIPRSIYVAGVGEGAGAGAEVRAGGYALPPKLPSSAGWSTSHLSRSNAQTNSSLYTRPIDKIAETHESNAQRMMCMYLPAGV
jgi:hypothetical protein